MKADRPIPFAGCLTADPRLQEQLRMVYLGFSDDSRSSYRDGARKAPAALRTWYDGRSFNSFTESGCDLQGRVADLGDHPAEEEPRETFAKYRRIVEQQLEATRVPFICGGDHAVTSAVVAAYACRESRLHVVQIDAHPDLYPEYEGDPYSHACTGFRILEMDHVESLTQLGIRTFSRPQGEVADRFKNRLRIHFARELENRPLRVPHLPPGSDVYLTVDLDGIDPAYAPGVSHPVPGGLSTRQVLNLIQDASWNLVGMDVVEVNPGLDRNGQTAILAARLLHEGMGQALLAATEEAERHK